MNYRDFLAIKRNNKRFGLINYDMNKIKDFFDYEYGSFTTGDKDYQKILDFSNGHFRVVLAIYPEQVNGFIGDFYFVGPINHDNNRLSEKFNLDYLLSEEIDYVIGFIQYLRDHNIIQYGEFDEQSNVYMCDEPVSIKGLVEIDEDCID